MPVAPFIPVAVGHQGRTGCWT